MYLVEWIYCDLVGWEKTPWDSGTWSSVAALASGPDAQWKPALTPPDQRQLDWITQGKGGLFTDPICLALIIHILVPCFVCVWQAGRSKIGSDLCSTRCNTIQHKCIYCSSSLEIDAGKCGMFYSLAKFYFINSILFYSLDAGKRYFK